MVFAPLAGLFVGRRPMPGGGERVVKSVYGGLLREPGAEGRVGLIREIG